MSQWAVSSVLSAWPSFIMSKISGAWALARGLICSPHFILSTFDKIVFLLAHPAKCQSTFCQLLFRESSSIFSTWWPAATENFRLFGNLISLLPSNNTSNENDALWLLSNRITLIDPILRNTYFSCSYDRHLCSFEKIFIGVMRAVLGFRSFLWAPAAWYSTLRNAVGAKGGNSISKGCSKSPYIKEIERVWSSYFWLNRNSKRHSLR